MNKQIISFPVPKTGKISLVVAPKTVIHSLMSMLAVLALRGRVIVVDGGNCFDAYSLARALRRRTHQIQPALKAVQLSRAFTCYQMVAMLAELPVDGTPVIVLDLLSTFLDENVNFSKRQRLLDSSLNLLRQISEGAPLAACTAGRMPKESSRIASKRENNRRKRMDHRARMYRLIRKPQMNPAKEAIMTKIKASRTALGSRKR